MRESGRPSVQPSQAATIKEVTQLLEKMSSLQDYGEIAVKIEAGKPIWVEAHPKIRAWRSLWAKPPRQVLGLHTT